jgi:guanylate kinase
MSQGKLIIIMGPTGSGKGTLEKHVKELHPEIVLPVSATTRAPRPGEKDGDHYHFLSREEFEKHIAEDYFLEYASYGGNYYGTPKNEVLPRLANGEIMLLEIEVQGVRQVRDLISKEDRIIVYVDAGSWEHMEKRVRARAPITEEELAKRKVRFEDEETFKPEADVIIQNQDGRLPEAKQAFADLIESVIQGTA